MQQLLIRHLPYLIILLLLTGCSGPSVPRLPSGAVILAFGDSLTYGTGAASNASYPAILSQLVGYEVVNAGIPGEQSEPGRARLPRVLDEVRPDLLILCHGGNDFLQQKDPQQTADNIRAMIEMAQQRGISVVLLGVPEFGLFLSAADFYQDVAEEKEIPYEGNVLSDILGQRALKSDSVHPNAAGYRVLAEAVAALLAESGAI